MANLQSPTNSLCSTNSSGNTVNTYWNSISTSLGIGNISDYCYTDLFETLKLLLSCLPEAKIADILDIAKENTPDNDTIRRIIRDAVRCRHYSEDFLLKYIDYLDKDIIFVQHMENILSREYHSLALLLEERDKK